MTLSGDIIHAAARGGYLNEVALTDAHTVSGTHTTPDGTTVRCEWSRFLFVRWSDSLPTIPAGVFQRDTLKGELFLRLASAEEFTFAKESLEAHKP